MSDTAAQGIMTDKMAMREKYWIELSDADKIERLHQVVRGLMGTADGLRDQLYQLNQHTHSPNGQLLVPLHESGGLGNLNTPGGYRRPGRGEKTDWI